MGIRELFGTSSGASTDTPSIVCRTRGNSNPHGKARVFIAFSPEDGERYPEEIVAILHKFQNCAVYYLRTGSRISQNDLEAYLSEMQLIVAAVTRNLLTKPNAVLDLIFSFAKERHIPVLPLMMEPDPDDLFTAKFGQAQYLEPGKRDATAIPFEKKIEKYLLRVLVGDELAQRVRDAFAAYIFLSYRKKDRAYAQELMRMIHRSERCRDIAIWYDEYLTAGENFNESIRAALEKGLLFALVVTPNLLEEGNYVMRNEYPAAREWGKTILPVLMEETDAEALKTMYDGIPEPVDIRDGGNWEQVMEQYFYKIATAERTDDPQHNFLIGLAYLDGIDVEVDSQKAVSLITKAAESGLIEAANKLAAMYHDGKGVAKDHRASLKWLEKAAELCRDAWKKTGHFLDMVELSKALNELGGAYYDMSDIEAAKKTYIEMLNLVEGQKESAARWLLLGCYSNMGNMAEAEGNLTAAMEWYLKGLDVMQSLSLNADQQGYLSYYYLKMGDIEEQRGNLAEAQKYYEKSREIDERMSRDSGAVESRRSLSVDYERLGDLSKRRGNLAEAKNWYEKSYEIYRQLAEETDTPASRKDLYAFCSRIGDLEREAGNNPEAEKWLRRAYEILQSLPKESITNDMRRLLMVYCRELGEICFDLGKYEEAEKWLERVLEVDWKSTSPEMAVLWYTELAQVYVLLGKINEYQHDIVPMKKYYEKGANLGEQLLKPDQQGPLISVYQRLAGLEKRAGNYPATKKWCAKALAVLERNYSDSDAEDILTLFYINRVNLAEIEEKSGNLSAAEAWYVKSIESAGKLYEKTKSAEAYDYLAISYFRLGVLGGRINKEYVRKAYMIWMDLSEYFPDRRDIIQKRDAAWQVLTR